MATDAKLDATILRHPALGDIKIGHHLNPRRDGERQMSRRGYQLIKYPIGLDTNTELVLERLEMQVAGMVLDCHQQHHVQQLANRRAVGQRLDTCQVDGSVAGDFLGRGGQLFVRFHVQDQRLDTFT